MSKFDSTIKYNQFIDDVEKRVIDDKELTVDIIASTPAKDSHGSRIDQSGWILDRFLKNPVIHWAHDDRGYTQADGEPIANAIPETVRVEDGKLKMKIRFTPEDINPKGYRIYKLIKGGFLHGVSVKFRLLKRPDEVTDDDGSITYVYRSMELLEVSIVSIPSNSETLVQRALAQGVDVEMVKAELRSLEDNEPEDTTEDIAKYKNYFLTKQPINKLSGKFLKKMYKHLNLDIPADEQKAWEGLTELVEKIRMDEEEETKEPTPVETPPEPQEKIAVLTFNELDALCQNLTKSAYNAGVAELRKGRPLAELNSVMADAISKMMAPLS